MKYIVSVLNALNEAMFEMDPMYYPDSPGIWPPQNQKG